ncbi:MAG: transporter suffix domain-containing protein [Thermoanaerobaculales bacterium]|nr:transporter suffix domain-containing protein [Thermoanaerobaculales bacterium]
MIPSWRIPVGVAIFGVGFAAPLAVPLVTASGLPPGWKAVISGALAVGVPEVMMVIATAVMGKEGFAELKRRIGRFFRRYGPPDAVGPTRYRVGLALFVLPLVLGWLGPYLGGHLPAYDRHPVFWLVGGDLLFVTSLFVLGGDFWDKLRALFVHGARAVFPGKGGTDA